VSAASVIPPLATGWVAQPVTFQAGGVTIYGTYTHPRHAPAQTLAAAVLLGGSGTATDRNDDGTLTASNGLSVWQGNRDMLEAVANWLSADGVASLRYDKLGSGRTGWGRYAGHTDQVGLQTYEQEAVAALRFLARQPQVSPSRPGSGRAQRGRHLRAAARHRACARPQTPGCHSPRTGTGPHAEPVRAGTGSGFAERARVA
jgi:hypothetical protein